MTGAFEKGDKPTLDMVLETRENRAALQLKLLTKFPGKSILSFKLNIPGPVKNNELFRQIFDIGREDILAILVRYGLDIHYQKALDLKTGPELFMMVEAQPQVLKGKMVVLEEETPLGRTYDIDVLTLNERGVRSVSRTELGFASRSCLVCRSDARLCGRNRTHSMEELHEQLEKLMKLERRLRIK